MYFILGIKRLKDDCQESRPRQISNKSANFQFDGRNELNDRFDIPFSNIVSQTLERKENHETSLIARRLHAIRKHGLMYVTATMNPKKTKLF